MAFPSKNLGASFMESLVIINYPFGMEPGVRRPQGGYDNVIRIIRKRIWNWIYRWPRNPELGA